MKHLTEMEALGILGFAPAKHFGMPAPQFHILIAQRGWSMHIPDDGGAFPIQNKKEYYVGIMPFVYMKGEWLMMVIAPWNQAHASFEVEGIVVMSGGRRYSWS